MRAYDEIAHIADRAFKVRGLSLEDLFTNAALALTAIQAVTVQEGSCTAREVEVTGVDREALLVNWLTEILYLQEKHRESFSRFEVQSVIRFNPKTDMIKTGSLSWAARRVEAKKSAFQPQCAEEVRSGIHARRGRPMGKERPCRQRPSSASKPRS